jgi:DNA-binding response OmpR family regulator
MEVEIVPPERRELNRAARGVPPEVVLADSQDGPGLTRLRDLLGRLHLGTSIAYVAVTRGPQVATAAVEEADDVLDAAAAPEEALYRIRRAAERRPPATLQLDELVLRSASYEAVVAGRAVLLSPLQFALLWCLASHPNRTFSRDELEARVWRASPTPCARRVDTCIHRLRDRLGDFGRRCLRAVPGAGYSLVAGSRAGVDS